MRIPHAQNLYSQSFLFDTLEFVWIFEDKQFLLQVRKDGSLYIEAGIIDSTGNYVDGSHWMELFPNRGSKSLNDPELWNDQSYNFKDYNFFTSGEDLIQLASDCIDYLK